jgi:trypsin
MNMKIFLYISLIASCTREVFATVLLNTDSTLYPQQNLRSKFLPVGRRSNGDDGEELKRDLIIGGSLADSQEYQSYAVTDPLDNSGGLCGATLIYPDILVSAAHCGVGGIFNNGVLMNIGATSIYGEDAIDRIEIVDQLIHPDYDSVSLSNDIMLIKLSSPSSAPPSTWNTDATVPAIAESLTIIGHGKTETGSTSQFLLEATVSAVDDNVCAAAYARSASSTIDSNVVLCAVSDVATTCSGDSGGPIFRGSLLVGIVSFGIVSEFDGSCISNFPSGFTRISAFSDFISKSICTLSASPPDSCFSSADLPVPVPTDVPINRPPTQSPATSRPTLIPTFSPLQFILSFTPFTPVPTISPITAVPSLLPSSTPSIKDSSNPSSVPSYNPSPIPSYYPSPIPAFQTNLPSTFPIMIPSDALSIYPTRSSENTNSTASAVKSIQGENRGFGIDVQSSTGSYRRNHDSYDIVVLGLLVHGIALMHL